MGFVVGETWANTNDDLRTYQRQGERQKTNVSALKLNQLKAESEQTMLKNMASLQSILHQAKENGPKPVQSPKGLDGAALFVSFSMPEALLFSLADEASRYRIPLVIKGLVDGDFKKTISTFARLQEKAKKQQLTLSGVSIDPIWFEQFDIQAVPALLVTSRSDDCKPQLRCSKQVFDVVYGNARIQKGLTLIAEKGELSLLAKSILEQRHV